MYEIYKLRILGHDHCADCRRVAIPFSQINDQAEFPQKGLFYLHQLKKNILVGESRFSDHFFDF